MELLVLYGNKCYKIKYMTHRKAILHMLSRINESVWLFPCYFLILKGCFNE